VCYSVGDQRRKEKFLSNFNQENANNGINKLNLGKFSCRVIALIVCCCLSLKVNRLEKRELVGRRGALRSKHFFFVANGRHFSSYTSSHFFFLRLFHHHLVLQHLLTALFYSNP